MMVGIVAADGLEYVLGRLGGPSFHNASLIGSPGERERDRRAEAGAEVLSPRSARSSSSRQTAILRCASASGIVGYELAKSALAPTTTMMSSSGMFLRSSIARVAESPVSSRHAAPSSNRLALTCHPEFDILQASLVRDVIDEDGSQRPSVKQRCQRAEAFLACGIPELQVDLGVVDHEFFGEQARADRRRASGTEATSRRTSDERGLADALTADCGRMCGRKSVLCARGSAASGRFSRRTDDDFGFKIVCGASSVSLVDRAGYTQT